MTLAGTRDVERNTPKSTAESGNRNGFTGHASPGVRSSRSPGHRQGRGADPRSIEVIGQDAFGSDVLASPGLDDRLSRGGYLAEAENLMADAVGADSAFFSTCGSSLSVKAAMMAGGMRTAISPIRPRRSRWAAPGSGIPTRPAH